MKNRQLILNMTSTMLAFCVNMGINFFLTPYITKNVGVEAYGFITLANNFVMYASLLTIALNSMIGRVITIEFYKFGICESLCWFIIADAIFLYRFIFR